MSTIVVSGEGIDAPTACCPGKCLFACSAAFKTGLICIAQNRYVDPGPVPTSCPVLAVSASVDRIKKLLELDSRMKDDGR